MVLHIACGVSAGIVLSSTMYTVVKQFKVCEISGSHAWEDEE
jgi:hypothetical protein